MVGAIVHTRQKRLHKEGSRPLSVLTVSSWPVPGVRDRLWPEAAS